MSFSFDPAARAVLVEATLVGPKRVVSLSLTLDTGATRTVVRPYFLTSAGYELSSGRPLRMRSTTGRSDTRIVRVSRFDALDTKRTDFDLVAHDLPVGVLTDGLLGLDFLRGRILILDFARGRMALRPPRWWAFWR
jgi:predicted aspartyl protease